MLDLPASNQTVLAAIVTPAMAELPAPMDMSEARCMLLAIGRQESGFLVRQQDSGPAHGLWQFERNGVLAVMHNTRTAALVYSLCERLAIKYGSTSIYAALLTDDILACCLARLLLWCDPRPLPAIGDVIEAWNTYERSWRPGRPSYSRWKDDAYPAALSALRAAA